MAEEKMNLERQVLAAKADLAGRLEVPAEDIGVLETRHVTWPDSALGCPEPGMMYAQVLTPGVLIVLSHAGTSYRYHAAVARVPTYCPDSRADAPAPGGPVDR